jgi:hypothetical protein
VAGAETVSIILDTVVALNTRGGYGLVVTNADRFFDECRLHGISESGEFQGACRVLAVDIANETIWLYESIPDKFAPGTRLCLHPSFSYPGGISGFYADRGQPKLALEFAGQ